MWPIVEETLPQSKAFKFLSFNKILQKKTKSHHHLYINIVYAPFRLESEILSVMASTDGHPQTPPYSICHTSKFRIDFTQNKGDEI